MTTTTAPSNTVVPRKGKHGFTLIELMIVLSISSMIILMGVSSIVFITKNSASLSNYINMNQEGRVALEIISRDIRMSMDVNTATETQMELEVYGQGGATDTVIYTYAADNKTVYRTINGDQSALLEDVEDFNFNFYNLRREATTELISIKEVQMEAYMLRKALSFDNTNYIISARFMMRNRHVSN